nr:hypothetical protein [Tanacetum cinerariifolium]
MVMIVNRSSRLSMSRNRVTIKTIMYPVNHHLSQAEVEEVLRDKEKFMQDTQTVLEKFNRFSFGFTPRVLTIAWERIDKIKYVLTEPEEIPELMYKLHEDDEEYTIQYKEYLEKYPDAVTTVLPNEEPEYSISMGYKHRDTTLEMESDEIIKSSVEELVPIPRECEVTLEYKNECDVPVCENSPIFDDHFEILSDFNNSDDILSDDDGFEDIEYVEAPLPDPKLVSLEEENDVYQEDEEERLTSIVKNDISDDSTNDLLLEEVNLFLASDNSIPSGIENFDYDSKGDICFLKELLIDDSIPLPNNESFDFEDDPSISRPPPESPDVEFDFEPNSGVVIAEEILDELNEDNCFDPGGEINIFKNFKDDDYFPFIFIIRIVLPYLIYLEVSPLLLSAKSEDTIFDPVIFV